MSARTQLEHDRILTKLNENESDVLSLLRAHKSGVEELVQAAISAIVSTSLEEVLFNNPKAVLAAGECPVAFLRALLTK